MKNGFVKSSPHFFKLIRRSMYGLAVTVLVMAAVIPAPLQEQANPASTPNPAKSAWFLLWIQELVSWSRLMIYPVMLLWGLFLLLPWLPGSSYMYRARWFSAEQFKINAITVMLFIFILGLTLTAMFFRGANWALLF